MIETIYSNPNELYHHGVKGMKWGVRKDKYSSEEDKCFIKEHGDNKVLLQNLEYQRAHMIKANRSVLQESKNNLEKLKNRTNYDARYINSLLERQDYDLDVVSKGENLIKEIETMSLQELYHPTKDYGL